MDSMAQTVGGGARAIDWRRGLAAIAVAWVAALPAGARELQGGAPPDWVDRVAVPLQAQAAPGTTSGGVQYLLSDEQTRLEAHDLVVYHHFATRALTGEGVEDAAHVKVSFDPSYETLTLHAIDVHRGGRILGRLDLAKVRLLQRETDLEARIYDGRKTADVMLEDVRIGDVVEVAYTIRGVNPAFRDRVFGSYELQWKVPVKATYARLLVPEGRALQLAPRNTGRQPEVRHPGGWVDYVWRADDVAAVDEDDDEPSWHDPFASVQWSEYPDWASVAAWALPLYAAAPDQGPELRAQVDAIAHASADPGQRLLATLRFVQREVRYLGIEVGIGSQAPRSPREVLEHRFGDCKDKALLTVWMLRALGIAAQPALVNTRLTHALDQYQPAPGQFDHVVVHARIDGHDYWLDPTRAEQKGTLQNLSQAAFGRALVVDATTTGLQSMVDDRSVLRRIDVHTVFDATAGPGHPMSMEVTTVYQGESAEWVRRQLAGASHDEVQRNYVNFYASFYPGVTVTRPFMVGDDDAANRLTLTEFYSVGDLWKRSDPDKRFAAEFSSPEIDTHLHVPQRTVRSGPVSLTYPLSIASVTEIRLHKDWHLDIKPGVVEDPAFHFSDATSAAGHVVTMTQHLETLADHVPADHIAAYVGHVRAARDSLGLQLFVPDAVPEAGASGLNLPVALLGLLMAAGAVWLGRRAWRHDPAPTQPAPEGSPRGLGGWLILPTIAIVLMPFRIGKDLVSLLPSYNAATWAHLTVVGGANYNPWWGPILLFELGVNILLVVGSVTLLVLFFRKRSSLPMAWIVFTAASIGLRCIDELSAYALPEVLTPNWPPLVRDAIVTVLWIAYFSNSRRVAATFVERLRPAPVAPEAPPETPPGADLAGDAATSGA